MVPTSGAMICGRYRLERPIGTGGMGCVWAGVHMLTHRPVALKFLRDADDSREVRLRFVREARAACAVVHPNVVQVLDFLEFEGEPPALVLELLEGETLRQKLAREHHLSVRAAVELLAPVVSAVGTAHAVGVVHRDLKPDNIFLQREPDGTVSVKVLDFGVAKIVTVDAATRTDAGLTHTGALLGTPTHMAPEQVFGETDVDHRADIWAMGIILYECLTGVLPTAGGNPGQVFKHIVTGAIQPVRSVAPDLPADLAALVDAMLSRDRADRPADLHVVADVLARHGAVATPPFGPPRASTEERIGGAAESPREPRRADAISTLPLAPAPVVHAPSPVVPTPSPAGAPEAWPVEDTSGSSGALGWAKITTAVTLAATLGLLVVWGYRTPAGRPEAPRPTVIAPATASPEELPRSPATHAAAPAPVPVSAAVAPTASSPGSPSEATLADAPGTRAPGAALRRRMRPAALAPVREAATSAADDPYGF